MTDNPETIANGDSPAPGSVPGTSPGRESGPAETASPWRESLAEDLRAHPALGGFDSLDALAREHVHLQKLIGRKGIIPPGEDAGDDERDRFYAALGRPEQASDYDLSELERPDDLPWNEDFEARMLERMHSAGLTNEQARALVEGFAAEQGELWQGMQADQTRSFEESLAALRTEWGNGFDARLDLANRAFAAAFGNRVDDARRMRLADGSYLGDHPDMVRAFAEMGELLGEAEFVGPASGQGGLSRDQARHRMADLESDPDFRAALLDRAHPEHCNAVARRSRLAAQAFGEHESTVADMRG